MHSNPTIFRLPVCACHGLYANSHQYFGWLQKSRQKYVYVYSAQPLWLRIYWKNRGTYVGAPSSYAAYSRLQNASDDWLSKIERFVTGNDYLHMLFYSLYIYIYIYIYICT